MSDHSNKDWTAVVLAGGIGSRLHPLTKEKPKPMVPIANRPMIDYAIQLLKNADIKNIIVVVKFLGEQIRDWIEEKQAEDYFGDLEILCPKVDSKDTADAVRKVSHLIDGNFVVTMADIVTNLDLRKAIKFHEEHDPLGTICLKPVELPGQFGLTMIDNESRIHLFLEKPTPQELYMTTLTFSGKGAIRDIHHNLANIGIYILNHKILSILDSYGDLMDWGGHVFPFLLDQNYDVRGFLSDPYWMDAGTHGKYIWANNDVLKKWSYPFLPNEEETKDNIFIGNNVEIAESANLIPPIVIGDNSSIGENASIGPYVTIGKNVSINDNSQITQSVIMDGSKISSNSNLESTILSKNVEIATTERQYKMVFPSRERITELKNEYRWK